MKYSTPDSFSWFFSLAYFFLSKIAVPVFLMIMGGLLLCKVDSPKKSFQRVLRIAVVLLVFSVVYYVYFHRNALDTMSFSDFFNTIFTRRVTNAFWYLYTYIGLLILLPILQRVAQALSEKSMLYLIFLSVGVMGTIPMLNIFFDFSLNPYFTNTFFVPMLGLVFVGFFIEKHLKINKTMFAFACFIFLAIITFEVTYTYNMYQENTGKYLMLDNRDLITITLCAICFYIIIKYLSSVISTKEGISKVLCYIGSLTFGIYLFSDLAIDMTKTYYAQIIAESTNLVSITILWEIFIFIACAIPTAILRLIPGVKKYL